EILIIVLSVGIPIFFTVVILAVVFFFVFRLLKGLGDAKASNAKLLQTGAPGDGRILQVGTGGMTVTTGVQRSVQVNLTLEVQPHDGSSPFQAQLSPLVPEIAFARLQPGTSVPV